jgi:hypothetical protein
MRNPSFQAAMARIALLAALLLAAVPTLGRLAPQVAHAAHAGLAALCTADGLRYVDVNALPAVAHEHDAGHPGTAPDKPHEHGAPDCAYCPLLLSLLVAGCWLLWLRAVSACGVLPPWPASSSRAFTHPCGLGSRGPPRADACLRA